MTLYIVKRSFKSNGKVYLLGSVITDPSGIHLFKTKIKDGKLIEVTEQNVESIAAYVLTRTGVDPTPIIKNEQEIIANKKLLDEEQAKQEALAKEELAKQEALAKEEQAKQKELAEQPKVVKTATVVLGK